MSPIISQKAWLGPVGWAEAWARFLYPKRAPVCDARSMPSSLAVYWSATAGYKED